MRLERRGRVRGPRLYGRFHRELQPAIQWRHFPMGHIKRHVHETHVRKQRIQRRYLAVEHVPCSKHGAYTAGCRDIPPRNIPRERLIFKYAFEIGTVRYVPFGDVSVE